MGVPLSHPLATYHDPFLYGDITKTWMQIGHPYWIELVDNQARFRFTSIRTGMYVIAGPLGKMGQPLVDEAYRTVIPEINGQILMRVRLEVNKFDIVRIGQSSDLITKVLANPSLAICIHSNGEGFGVTYSNIFLPDKERIRDLQKAHITGRQEQRHEDQEAIRTLDKTIRAYGGL